MSKKLICLFSFVLVLSLCLGSAANAADVTPQLYVTFDGSLSGSNYVAGAGEIVNGTLSLKNGTEVLYGGILTTAGGQDGLHFMPTDSLASKNAVNEDIITTSFVIEGLAKRNAPSAGFQTFFCVYGSVGYRYLSGNPTDTQYWTHGPTSTGWAVVSGDGQPVSDTDMVHYALVYEYVSDTECKLSYYVDAVQFGDTLINSTAAGGESTRGMMFAGDPHPSATDRGMPLDVDTIAFSTFTGTFNPETDFILPGGPGALAPASNPKPRDGAMLEATWTNLSWRAGDFAVSHDVYIGESFDDVNDATHESEAFAGNQTKTDIIVGFPTFPIPGGLAPGTTYYWRIDEVNDTEPNSPWKGSVWSFWIQPNKAYDPVPTDGVKFVVPDVTLSWAPGLGARLHYVYLGENFDDVNSAAGALPQTDTTYSPGTLEVEKTYYWRVDEFDGLATYKGDVWSFTTVPDVKVTNPDLVGFWTLDEGQGVTAVDWSGHGNHGRVELQKGDPQWVDGYHAGAMDMAGVTSVHIPAESWSTIETQVTLALWTYGDSAVVPNNFIFGAFAGSSRVFSAHVPWDGLVYFDSGQTPGDDYDRISKTAIPSEYKGNWRHWTFVKNTETGSKEIYLDGELWYSETGMTRVMTGVTAFTLGSHPNGSNPYRGIMDDVRLYNKALTAEQIAELMLGNTKLAGSPVPARHATVDIRDISSLSWSAGDTAASHDVYFGADRDAVAAATKDSPEFKGNQAGTSLSLAGLVEFGGGDYYWRIDEVEADGTVITGTIWKFTVPDYLIVDDFEAYDVGNKEIWWSWKDGLGYPARDGIPAYPGNGTGSAVGDETSPTYMEMSIVHSGAQSMPVSYDNNFMYSEVSMTLVSARDWTEEGVDVLSLWFYGDAANAVERMYVALNGSAVVYHDNPDAALIDEWTEWTIDLQEFAAQGVNLANVNTISIGFGDKNNLQAGGSGMVLFDDIRLYRPSAP